MGRFLGSLDGIGVKGGKPVKAGSRAPNAAVSASRPAPSTPSARLVVSENQSALEVRPAPPVRTVSTISVDLPSAPARVARDLAATEQALAAIREDIGDCKRCRLCEGRTKIVFGQGSPGAELMFVGEAPGADEDASGLAFVGRAGQLLTDMIEKGMKMKRADVYIANVIKCRPPGNRPPETDEVLNCQPFLEAQIRTIRPRAIVALGATAAKFMTRTADPISRLRSRFASWDGIPVMPTYHPAYLLRNPAAKKDVWADLKLVMDVLGTRGE
ncbi:MAG: uracil-DNA glycosylase [Vicinamibacteria bacterium]|nr:uracil-DNA glycosylase [Vicinamibacteria bacterium]